MTTERQHTLVGCATCGTGYQPKYMVSVGDERLCTQCAGAEIGRLREQVDSYRKSTHEFAGLLLLHTLENITTWEPDLQEFFWNHYRPDLKPRLRAALETEQS